MLTQEENDLLTRVGSDTPMGQIMRRHWLPALLSEEIPERDGAPVRVRLLGEDLVAFRDSEGRVGLIGEYCSHRQASLFYGRNEECGLRCLYHGWKFDVAGNVLEMSSEPRASGFAGKVKHKSYPVHEAGGYVWTYMGPAETMPQYRPPVFAPDPDTRISTVKIVIDCNWAQILEGAIDSAHSSMLHSSDMVPAHVDGAKATDQNWLRPSHDKAPRLQVERAGYGFQYAAIRKPIVDADTHDYVRTTLFVAPYTVLIPPNDRYRVALLHVPMDDTHTAFHFIAFGGDATPDQETWRKFCHAQIGVDLDKTYRKTRTRENDYLQDRQAMKLGNWTGVPGIPNQDIVMWETMGPIVDRTADRLGTSDMAVAQFRRIMVEAARKMQAGEPAIGTTEPRTAHASLRSFEGIVPKSADWRALSGPQENRARERQQGSVA
ncbi:MAG: Rieske 2Fe-2S domain-containing protein [Proteobacteria bacterium]|nr:Rieske 2Fe-2S domain-containing protein [Pseudomonadota bacterium]